MKSINEKPTMPDWVGVATMLVIMFVVFFGSIALFAFWFSGWSWVKFNSDRQLYLMFGFMATIYLGAVPAMVSLLTDKCK